MILLIDNYDSFTYNLYQYLAQLRYKVAVYRHDKITLHDIERLSPSYLVISPGPGNPDQAGISLTAIAHFSNRLPILGVCLGHQALGKAFGAQVVHARQIMHGKISYIVHHHSPLFYGLNNPLQVTRYHSLVLDKEHLPTCFIVTAWSEHAGEKDEIMAIQHRQYPLFGVQFHPESILTEQGHELLQNFLNYR